MTWKLGSKLGEQTLSGVVRGSDVTGEYVTQVGGREATSKTAAKTAILKPASNIRSASNPKLTGAPKSAK